MLNLKIDAAKRLFFDIEKIEKRADAMIVRETYQQTMFHKRAVQTSMRSGGKKGKRSAPGEPPRTHGQRLLRTKTFGVYDNQSRSGIVGPALINGRARMNRGQTVPQTLEYGGNIDVIECLMPDGTWKAKFAVPVLQARFLKQRKVTGKVEARPFVGPKSPAWKKSNAKFADQFRGQFNRAA